MSQVIINDIPPRTQATASGGQVIFGCNWTANYPSDVIVYSRPANTDADDFTQILSYPADYSVAFIGGLNEVQVTLTNPSTLGDIVTITRMTPADRENLYSNTNFVPSMLNNDFGILTLVDQQAQLVNQLIGPRYNYSAIIVDVVDTILPILGANQFWGKNAGNTAIVALDIAALVGGGTVTEIDTGLGLTGGPITTTGTISFAAMSANTFWGNITSGSAVPTQVATSYFLKSANNLSDLANAATARSNLGVAIGTNVEAWSAILDSVAALAGTVNTIPFFASSGVFGAIGAAASSVLITSAGSVPSLSATLPSAVQANITKLGVQSQALNMNSYQINNVTDPTNPQDAVTLAYLNGSSGLGAYLPLVGGTMAGIISMGNHKITNLTDPSSGQDAVTLTYLNSASALGAYLPLSGGTMTGIINMGSHKITSLTDPTNPQDAATKNYVDITAAGLTIQPAVYAASTVALTVTYANGASGIGATLTNNGAQATFALDGTNPAVNSRVLIWNQASALQNGIYTVTNVGSGASNWILTRATDFDQPSEIVPGDLVIVNNGTLYAGTSFIQTATVTAVGTDAINFSQFTFSASSVLLKANNLSDVANATTSFNNISPLTTKGDLIGYSTQNVRLAVGSTNGQLLQVSSGAATGLAWSTATYPATTTINQILYSSSANVVGGISSTAGGILTTNSSSVPSFLANPSSTGNVLQSVSGNAPAFSTATYPSVATSTGTLMRADGTNWVHSTSTFADTYSTHTILYASSANTVSGLATANNGVLFTDGSGVPSIGTAPIVAGGTGVTSVTTSPTASSFAGWDANKNLSANSFINGYASTATNATTTTLTVASSFLQFFTGITTQTVVLPVTSTLVLGQQFSIYNNSSGVVTVQSSGANTIQAMAAGTTLLVTVINTGVTTAAGWNAEYVIQSAISLPLAIASGGTAATTASGARSNLSAAVLGANGDITSMTGLSGALAAPTAIQSSTGVNLMTFTYTASAVNYIQLANNATGGNPSFTALGSDTNIGLNLITKGAGTINIYDHSLALIATFNPTVNAVNYIAFTNNATGLPPVINARGTDTNIDLNIGGKGTGAVNILGASTNSSATSGYVGEFVSSVIASASAVSLTTATTKNITSIALTAGDWDVWGNAGFTFSVSGTGAYCWVSSTSATVPDLSLFNGLSVTMVSVNGINTPTLRFSLSSTTTIYLSCQAAFASGTGIACGGIYARRVR